MRGFSTIVLRLASWITTPGKKGRPTYWDETPATNESSKKLTAADVDVLGGERHEVVGGTDGVGRDVDTEGDDDQANSAKGGGSTATMGAGFHPQIEDLDRVPDNVAICQLGRCGGEDTKQTNNGCRSRD